MSNMILENVANDSAMTGFGAHSIKEVEELQKALSISQNYGTTAPSSLTGGSALSVEDLDRTLKLVTYGLEHLKLWKDIIKEKVTQAVGEFNVQNAYGEEVSPFFTMGSTPTASTATYNRQVYQVKYLGTQCQVQHNLTLIQAAHGPVIAREVKNKTVELLGKNERAMFDASSAINALEYDGIFAQIKTKEALAAFKSSAFAGFDSVGVDDSVIMRLDAMFDEDAAEDAALMNVNNFGMAMDMYIGTDVHSKFSKTIYNKQRTIPGAVIVSGNRIKEHNGTIDYRFKPSLFCRPRKAPLAVAVGATAAPTLANGASPVTAAGEFAAADAATYSYKISSVYADGETLPSSKIDIAVSAGDAVTVDISYTGSPLYFNVFRAPKGTVANWEFICRIAATTSAATYYVDYNEFLPGSAKAYLLMNDPDVLCFKQLGSMIKYDLAVTDTSYKWLQLLYGCPLVAAARKNVIVKNILLS